MNIYLLFRALWRRAWLIGLVAVGAAVITFLFTADYKRQYRSVAQLATGFTVKEDVSLDDARFNIFEANVKFDNLVETITSPVVVGLLSYRLLLYDLENERTPFRQTQEKELLARNAPAVTNLPVTTTVDILHAKLDSNKLLTSFDPREKKIIELLRTRRYDYNSLTKLLSIERIKRTDYIQITAITENPELSAFMVNALCEEFFRYNRSTRRERSGESLAYFTDLVDRKKSELDLKAEELRAFKSSRGVIDFDLESESKLTQLAGFETALEEQRQRYRSLTLTLNDIDRQIRQAGSEPTDQSARIVSLRKEINTLNDQYIETGARDRRLRQRIDQLRTELNALLTQAGSGSARRTTSVEELRERRNETKVEQRIALENVRSLTDRIAQMRNSAGTYADKEANIESLEREVRLASESYLSAQEKYNAALNASSVTYSNIRQVLVGQPAVEPEPSQRLILTGLSGSVAAALMVLLFTLVEYVDLSIRTPSYFSEQTGLPLIGKVKHIPTLKKSDKVALDRKKDALLLEQLKKLRYEIERSGKQVVVFTSLKPEEGKSTVLQLLAQVMRLSKRRVLLIDANFEGNDLTKRLDAKPLLEKLITDAGQTLAVFEKHRATLAISEGTDAIGCEGGFYSPSEIMNPDALQALLDEVRQHYDYVFVESTALSSAPDTKEMVAFADGLVAVFSAQTTLRQSDNEAIAYLKQPEAKFIGSILNNVETRNLDY